MGRERSPFSTGGAGADTGIGDEILAAGEAARASARTPGKYQIIHRNGQPKWHWIWEGNPHVARPGEDHVGVVHGYVNGLRPYCAELTKERYTFREYVPHPAHIELPTSARKIARRAEGAVVFNPTVKDRAPPNKQWHGWRALVAESRDVYWIQVGEIGPTIQGAERIETMNLWDALGLLSGALAAVTHEGALHHAAAALGVPAVVVRGGFISPRVTGYDGQADLFEHDERYPLGCGMRVPCEHCGAAMASITPAKVLAALKPLLQETVAA